VATVQSIHGLPVTENHIQKKGKVTASYAPWLNSKIFILCLHLCRLYISSDHRTLCKSPTTPMVKHVNHPWMNLTMFFCTRAQGRALSTSFYRKPDGGEWRERAACLFGRCSLPSVSNSISAPTLLFSPLAFLFTVLLFGSLYIFIYFYSYIIYYYSTCVSSTERERQGELLIRARFRFQNLVTVQNFYFPSHQNVDTYMEY
jgi:hypothetical protein